MSPGGHETPHNAAERRPGQILVRNGPSRGRFVPRSLSSRASAGAGALARDGSGDGARLALTIEFEGHSVALAFYLASSMYEAMDDTLRLGGLPDPAALHARFLGWTTRSRRAPPTA